MKIAENYKLKRLSGGETFITSERGNSMSPLIKSGQDHKLAPTTWEECNVGIGQSSPTNLATQLNSTGFICL
jgi:hypothetical protein